MLSGVRAQIAIKVFGEDLDTLRSQAGLLRAAGENPRHGRPGHRKQVLAPQIKVRVDFDAAARYGISTAQLTRSLQTLVDGQVVTQIVEGNRRFDLVVRLPETARSLEGLANLLIGTPSGRIPLSRLASIGADGPNQITRDEGGGASSSRPTCRGRALSACRRPAPGGGRNSRCRRDISSPGRPVPGLEEAARLIAAGAGLDGADFHRPLQPLPLGAAGLIMANVPLRPGRQRARPVAVRPAAVGRRADRLHHAGRHRHRNGILKIGHYLNLMRFEGEAFGVPMIVRGSLERLTPVLMTALVAAFAAPLLFEAEQPGTEILHPVAVVIFSGLVSSTLLDTFVTPALFWLFGRKAAERLLAEGGDEAL